MTTKIRWELLTLILIAFALRLTRLNAQSLWYDEGVTWLLASYQSLLGLIQWTAADIQPPLYYLVMWLVRPMFGDSEYGLRFPSVIFNILTMSVIYCLAQRLFANRLTAILAIILTTLSPGMVYYSQEARMYTLLILAATLSSYLLLRTLDGHRPAKFGYIFVTTAALYTHYFALFLLLTHLLYAGYFLWQNPNRPRYPIGLMFGSLLLLFAPWLPILLARLGDDPSYWPGALKLNEASRKLVISFTVGETVLEGPGFWLAMGYLLLVGLMLARRIASHLRATNNPGAPTSSRLARKDAGAPRFASFLLLILWLGLPISLILLLAYQSPKFNPRYTLLAWPAFVLLVSWALTPQPAKRFSQALCLIALGLILATSTYSLTNWFTNRQFAKDDFRAMAQFVRERRAADETVLLSSGHLFPVWAYYYGWQGWTPLPDMPTLDVNRVVTLAIADQIYPALQNQGGVWLVNWQDEVIDPNGVIPFWLDLIGERPHDAGDFWGVRLEHWRLTDVARLTDSPIEFPVALTFQGHLKLLGYSQLSDTELVLFWQAQQTLPDQLHLTLDLTDNQGHDWDRETLTSQLGSFSYPPSRWPVGQTILTRHTLPWQIGSPPGRYIAEIEVGHLEEGHYQGWDIWDDQGRPQRRTGLLHPVNVSRLIEPATAPIPYASDPVIDFSPIIMLRRSLLQPAQAEPGDRLLLALIWQAGPFNLDDISLTFELIDATGQPHIVGSSATPSRQYHLPQWQPGQLVLGQYWLDIPPPVAPGPATLQLHLINRYGFVYDEIFPIEELTIRPTERVFELTQPLDVTIEADFAGQITLLGLTCQADCHTAAGQSLRLTSYWRAEAPIETNYTIFAHLLDDQEQVILNADQAPAKPTRGWLPGEIISDMVTLNVPANLQATDYDFEIGLYDAADPAFSRLPLTTGDNRVLLPDLVTVE